jgi:hypothetical protein
MTLITMTRNKIMNVELDVANTPGVIAVLVRISNGLLPISVSVLLTATPQNGKPSQRNPTRRYLIEVVAQLEFLHRWMMICLPSELLVVKIIRRNPGRMAETQAVPDGAAVPSV